MEGRKRIAVVGSDARQAAAGRALARAGYAVAGAEQVARADVILLPLPLDESRTPLAQLLRAAKPGAFALGGRLSAQAVEIARQAGVELADYFARPELAVYNAIPTAEGCIGILLYRHGEGFVPASSLTHGQRHHLYHLAAHCSPHPRRGGVLPQCLYRRRCQIP